MTHTARSVQADQVVYAVATMDTKAQELEFVASTLRSAGVSVCTVDVGTHTSQAHPFGSDDAGAHVSADAVASFGPRSMAEIRQLDRGAAVTAMSESLAAYMAAQDAAGRVAGVIGLGGSGGTAIVTTAMRRLPIGVPKLMVSTVASGNTAPYVDSSDICMMYSVVDVAGLNAVSVRVLANAAYAMAGMVNRHQPLPTTKPTVGMTMFGVTTACVTRVRKALEDRGFDCLVFHATGTGGRAMEKLVESGLIEGVLDITTTEVADEVVGGVFPAGPLRMDVILRKQIPCVVSVGALDMVNFGAKDTVPPQFQNRQLHIHNAQVTLMRTTEDENRQCAQWIARKLNQSKAPITVLIPEGGVSALDAPGQPFHNPAADAALFDELQLQLKLSAERQLRRFPHHVNDEQFAVALVDEFLKLHTAASRQISRPEEN